MLDKALRTIAASQIHRHFVWQRLRPAAALALLYGVALTAGAAAAWVQAGLVNHYPSDTKGGWCTALAVVPATARLVDHVASRWSVRERRSARFALLREPTGRRELGPGQAPDGAGRRIGTFEPVLAPQGEMLARAEPGS